MEQISKTLFNWATTLDPQTLEHAKDTSAMPFIYPHIALMSHTNPCTGDTTASVVPTLGAIIPSAVGMDIGCSHNFVNLEYHFGKNVWVSRKGAIKASKGHLGFIPGSQNTTSYIVEGKGNQYSLNSSPHIAGNNFSQHKIDVPQQTCKLTDTATELVEIKHTLRQILKIQGA